MLHSYLYFCPLIIFQLSAWLSALICCCTSVSYALLSFVSARHIRSSNFLHGQFHGLIWPRASFNFGSGFKSTLAVMASQTTASLTCPLGSGSTPNSPLTFPTAINLRLHLMMITAVTKPQKYSDSHPIFGFAAHVHVAF